MWYPDISPYLIRQFCYSAAPGPRTPDSRIPVSSGKWVPSARKRQRRYTPCVQQQHPISLHLLQFLHKAITRVNKCKRIIAPCLRRKFPFREAIGMTNADIVSRSGGTREKRRGRMKENHNWETEIFWSNVATEPAQEWCLRLGR